MNLNSLDTSLTRSKLRCILVFLTLSVFFSIVVVEMLRCSAAILKYASPQNYMQLFKDTRVSSFFLGKIVLNSMEYLYAGKGIIWVFFKSLDAVDILLASTVLMILFQDPSSEYIQTLRVFSGALFVFLAVSLVVYCWFLFQASIQLTTEAGFAQLRTGAFISRYLGIAMLLMCFLMNAVLWIMKKQ